MSRAFPPLAPFATGHLAVGAGQTIYWEASGNPQGAPALYLHGGPGGGIREAYRRHFDPQRHLMTEGNNGTLIVGFEQRGCGRSGPLAGDPAHDLDANTTRAQIADIEALRAHLGVGRWLLYGGSWGTTLALAYAQAHPERVAGLVLACVTTTSAAEVAWITEGVGAIFPREWEAFAASAHANAGEPLVAAYARRLRDPDPVVRAAAARAWCAWEDVHVSLAPGFQPYDRFEDPAFRLVFATLVSHYWAHHAFVPPLLAGVGRIAHLPAVLIHGRYDVSSPLETAWRLHKAWPGSELIVVEGEGHGGAAMVEAADAAIARLGA